MAKSKKAPETEAMAAEQARLERVVSQMRADRRTIREVREWLTSKKPQIKDALLAAQSVPSGEAGATILRNLIKYIMGTDSY